MEEYYGNLLPKKCPKGLKQTADTKTACWKRAIGVVNILFEELHVARVETIGVYFYTTPLQQNACFIHFILQELPVMKELKDGGFGGNKAVGGGLLDHIFESYVTRDAVVDSSIKLKFTGRWMIPRQGLLDSSLRI